MALFSLRVNFVNLLQLNSLSHYISYWIRLDFIIHETMSLRYSTGEAVSTCTLALFSGEKQTSHHCEGRSFYGDGIKEKRKYQTVSQFLQPGTPHQ